MKKKNNKIKGYVIASVGFLMIVLNALDYLLSWNNEFTPLGIIGLVLVVTGMNLIRRK